MYVGHGRYKRGYLWTYINENLILARCWCYLCLTAFLSRRSKYWEGSYDKQFTLCEKCPYSQYSGPYLPAFGLNTERYSVSLRIQSECGKMWTRITRNTDTLYALSDSYYSSCRNDLANLRSRVMNSYYL